MNKEEFAKGIVKYLRKGAIKNIIENLLDPPGRFPTNKDIELSVWYKNCSEEDKAKIKKIIQESVDESIFGFMCILDGVRTIIDDRGEGRFRLSYLINSQEDDLNILDGNYLHDLYKEETESY